jgi:uncharacterized protein (DUF362 family)
MLAGTLGAAGLWAGGALSTRAFAAEAPAAASATAPAAKPAAGAAPTAPVAIQRCESFDPKLLRERMDKAFDLIGGIKPLVQNKTVSIKLNLTGMRWDPYAGMPAGESYQTNPNTVAVLCAILNDAGARRIVLVENLYWERPFEESVAGIGWDVAAIKSAGGQHVLFEDIRNEGPFKGYSRFKVPWGGFIFPAFDFNRRLEQTDVLMSLSKLKQHYCAGVTMTIKNMFGATPCSIYGNDSPGKGLQHRTNNFHDGRKKVPDGHPAELDHGMPHNTFNRVSRIVSDIYGARPVDLTVVDGIRTISGGEGYWNQGVALQEPKVLLVGRNGVCTDSVGTAVMGFDPQAPAGHVPFRGDNHLQMLCEKGIGTNDLNRIEVLGLPVEQARFLFPHAKGEKFA